MGCKIEWWCPWRRFSRKKIPAAWLAYAKLSKHHCCTWNVYLETKTDERTVDWLCMGLCRNNVTQILLHPENRTTPFLYLQIGLKFAGATAKTNVLIFRNLSSRIACDLKQWSQKGISACYGCLPYPAANNTHLNFNSSYGKWRETSIETTHLKVFIWVHRLC